MVDFCLFSRGSESLDCDQVKKPARVVLMEWTELLKGEDPDYYIIAYQFSDSFSQKNIRNISKVERKPLSTTILLEENKKYDITIESIKNGQILSVKSFKTRGISDNDINMFATATTVSFNWSTMTSEFSVSVSLNDSSYIIQKNTGFFVWSNLTPATLYTFKLIFEQLHLGFMKVSQLLDVQAETGACSQGWLAFQGSCYRMSKESKPWKRAQQACELSSQGAHLLDIGSEEEHAFILSYLRTVSQIIMLWTGLNDVKEEGQLLWTDGSPYFQKAGISSLSMIPENETDCYALQRDPAGPDYFLTGFFCYIHLPYICEYECNYIFLNLFHLFVYSHMFSSEDTNTKTREKTVSPPTTVFIHPEDVQEESVILHWKLSQEGQESYIQVKPNSNRGETMKFLVNNTEDFKIDLLIPGMTYEIAVASVNSGNMSEPKTIQCTLKPKPVQIVVPYELYSHAVVLFVRMPDIGVFDGIYVTSKGGPNTTFILKSDAKITIENLTPGLAAPLNVREGNVTDTSIQIAWDRADGDFQQYEVTCTNCAGAFKVQKVKQETAVFSNLIPGKLYNFTIRTEKEGFRDSIFVIKEIETVPSPVKYLNYSRDSESITVTWPPAQNMVDGYVISISSKVFSKEKMLLSGVRMYKFEDLLPGTNFLIGIVTTNGLKKSHPTILKISTYPDPPSDLQVFGLEESTVYLSWKLPRGGFDMFQPLLYFASLYEYGHAVNRILFDNKLLFKRDM
nr:PREDICTED: uncharacterized protein LOC106488169 [Apteryx mantelli mantelli]